MIDRRPLVLLAIAASALAGGCGLGSSDEPSSDVQVTVTRDFGRTSLGRVDLGNAPAGQTVMRVLKSNFDVTTGAGDSVQQIGDVAGAREGGRRFDWFYYVNGIEAGKDAAERRVVAGDQIWWDRHDRGAATRIPAVVGSFPEPFLSGQDGKRLPVRLDCAPSAKRPCDEVATRLKNAGVKGISRATIGTAAETGVLRIVIGGWPDVRRDVAVQRIERGPGVSGVFARLGPDGRRIELLDDRGRVVRGLGPGSGLVAATASGDQAPTWVVTGTDDVGVAAAAAAMDENRLADRFALAVESGRGIDLPVAREDRTGTTP
jgi:uncharacterized protein DUF4430